jgi:hypothetical protein
LRPNIEPIYQKEREAPLAAILLFALPQESCTLFVLTGLGNGRFKLHSRLRFYWNLQYLFLAISLISLSWQFWPRLKDVSFTKSDTTGETPSI